MKSSLKYLALTFWCVSTFSCAEEGKKQLGTASIPIVAEEPELQPIATNTHNKASYEQMAKMCKEYWAEWNKLNASKADYFEKHVLAKALANPDLPEQNKKFLLALKEYLRQTPAEERQILAPDQLLFPIFRLAEGELGVIGSPIHDTSSNSFEDISKERSLLNRYGIKTEVLTNTEPKLVYHKSFADTLFKRLNTSVYTFTAQKSVKTQLQNFGTYTGECLEYYNYLLDPTPFNSNDRILFGSKYNLELVYKIYPEIDAVFINQLKPDCGDCPSSFDQEKTFASLKGVEGLYFVYADTFPLNNKLETPSRGLLMKMGNKVVYLWHDEIDLIGCSCI
ncbi:hypothetical protein H9Q13_09560 [Pontibacter sp. JH31]|uniref:Uncharacterized protein n=1 Tax=Pontibacter aquaedesilientis TaxID=2766980 RepID=A0ABR7XHH4_9BACT|nr:hypothetical protein [Pontibacter aquaedesilientis]MBD1397411.1 hypothetical protein [Pontibacter aquaedesilientis]